jgi:hypothetical protein
MGEIILPMASEAESGAILRHGGFAFEIVVVGGGRVHNPHSERSYRLSGVPHDIESGGY